MKYHFISSILFAVAVGFLALAEKLQSRIILTVVVIILFYASLILFAMEYEKQRKKAWDKKVKRIEKEAYEKFVLDYKSKKKSKKKK